MTSRIFGSRFTLNGVLGTLRVTGSPGKRRGGFTGARVLAATGVSKVMRLEEATEPFEEEFSVGRLEALSLLAGTSMMSSKSRFLLACDAGMMPIILAERTTGGGGGASSRG